MVQVTPGFDVDALDIVVTPKMMITGITEQKAEQAASLTAEEVQVVETPVTEAQMAPTEGQLQRHQLRVSWGS